MQWDGRGLYPVRQSSVCTSAVRIRRSKSLSVPRYSEEDFLAHFGIAGMKWGVRRYQNEDGTLTEEGKKRYGTDKVPESETWKKSDVENLSDEELNRRNSRLQRERQYKDLTTSEVDRERRQTRADLKKKIIQAALIVPIGAIVAYGATKLIKNNGIKAIDAIEKMAKTKISSIKTNNWLKKMAKTGSIGKNTRYAGTHPSPEFFPRNAQAARTYDYVGRTAKDLWKKKTRPWPAL